MPCTGWGCWYRRYSSGSEDDPLPVVEELGGGMVSRVAVGLLPHRIRRTPGPYAQAEKEADWEFTYDRDGVAVQVLNRNVLANARHAYALTGRHRSATGTPIGISSRPLPPRSGGERQPDRLTGRPRRLNRRAR